MESMPKRFFKLADDVYVPHRWHLDTPTDSHGKQVEDALFRLGAPVQEANVGVPVVHVRVASLLAALAPDDAQLLPVDVEGQPDQYLILVATRLIRCIDEKASRIRLWTHEDGLPDMVGQYASVRDLRIDKARTGSAQVFRLEGWIVSLLVSGEIKDAMERIGATGTRFEEV